MNRLSLVTPPPMRRRYGEGHIVLDARHRAFVVRDGALVERKREVERIAQ